MEGQLEDEERVSEMMKELQTTLEERRQAFDVLEEEANAMRTRLDVYANYGMDEEGNANHGGKGDKGKVSLPALWKKRQAAVRRAEELGLSEVELLRERLNDTEKRLNTIRSPLMDELQLLRKAQDSQGEEVLEAQQLWEDERRRFVEQIEVMDERVTFSERSVEEQINVLVGEIQAIEKIREQVQVGEDEWTNRSAKVRKLSWWWFVGLLVCWFVGLLVCWFVGLLVCWLRTDFPPSPFAAISPFPGTTNAATPKNGGGKRIRNVHGETCKRHAYDARQCHWFGATISRIKHGNRSNEQCG
jgi:hypothetical protein